MRHDAWLCLIERRNPRRPEAQAHLVLRDDHALQYWKRGWTPGAGGVCRLCGGGPHLLGDQAAHS